MLDNLGNLERTHSCGDLRPDDIGKQVVLMGWVAKRRDFGELTFVDLRDRAGITQVVFNAELGPEAHARAKELRGEYVIAVMGAVVARDENTRNPKIATGDVEVHATQMLLLNDARTPPFQLDAGPEGTRKRRSPFEVSISRSATTAVAVKPASASSSHQRNPSVHDGTGIHRNRNSDPDQVNTRRRTRLHRSFAHLSRKILCPAAITTIVQTVVHDWRSR